MYGPIGCREERASVFDVILTSECFTPRHKVPVCKEISAGRGKAATSDSRDKNSGGLVLGYQIVLLAHFYVDRPRPRRRLWRSFLM